MFLNVYFTFFALAKSPDMNHKGPTRSWALGTAFMPDDTYINSDHYHAQVDRLEEIARTLDPAAPDDLRTRIIEVLGVWPVYCQYRERVVLSLVAA
jgi:hypothetical protein